jgi:hypothetical protein
MLATLLLLVALTPGEANDSADDAGQAAGVPPADVWLLMQSLQGTYLGWGLDAQRVSISGWTELSETLSSNRVSNHAAAQ